MTRGGFRVGSGRHPKHTVGTSALLSHSVRVKDAKIRELAQEIRLINQSQSNIKRLLKSGKEGKEFLKKFERHCTFEMFLQGLNLSGTLQELMHSDPKRFVAFTPPQVEFLYDQQDFRIKLIIVISTRGGAKTSLSMIVIAFLLLKSRIRIGYIAGTNDQLKQPTDYLDTVLGAFHNILDIDNTGFKKLYNGSRYYNLSSTVSGARSRRLDICYLDEAVLIKQRTIQALMGLIVASKKACLRMATTPLITAENTIVKKVYDQAITKPSADTKIYKWKYTDCWWLNHEQIEKQKELMSYDEFNAEYNCEWGAKVGRIYNLAEVDRSKLTRTELLQVLESMIQKKMKQVWRAGIDWGTVHPTICLAGFLGPGLDADFRESKNILYITELKIWTAEQNKNKDQIITELYDWAYRHDGTLYSEENPESSSDNYRLERLLRGASLRLVRSTFGRKAATPEGKEAPKVDKEGYKNSAVKRFNHRTMRILDELTILIDQINDQEYKEDGSMLKKSPDDAYDAFLHLVQGAEGVLEQREAVQNWLQELGV